MNIYEQLSGLEINKRFLYFKIILAPKSKIDTYYSILLGYQICILRLYKPGVEQLEAPVTLGSDK